MSSTLSADAKDALSLAPPAEPHCRNALRAALFFYGTAHDATTFRTQRLSVARLAWSLLEDRKAHPLRHVAGVRLHRATTYEIDGGERTVPPKPAARCDRRMELRGAFLACGSLAAPARGYHLDFLPPDHAAARRLATLLRAEGCRAKVAVRKGRTIVYFKSIDEIVGVLGAIGAYSTVLHLEDVRALKETKNRIHRVVNTEAANVERAAGAAARQREAIAFLADAYGLGNLSAPQREIAHLRLLHPTETMSELGRRCSPPVNKSTVNGRIAALLRIARALHGKAGAQNGAD